jgi:hypothetical protein
MTWRILLAACIVGVLASWRLQLEPGTVGLLHDWSIAPSAGQNMALASQIFDGWYRWGLGDPVTFPTEYPLRFAIGALSQLGWDGALLTHVLVFAAPFAAFLSARLCARAWSGSDKGIMAAGVFYALNPVMLNKMVSGQTSYIAGYCFLPLAFWAFDRAVRGKSLIRASWFCGSLLALAGIQLQLGLVAAFLCFVAALVAYPDIAGRRRWSVLSLAFVTALAVHIPTIVGIWSGAESFGNRAQFSGGLTYFSINSIEFADALRLIGYLTHYDTVAIAQWSWLWNGAMSLTILAVLIGISQSPSPMRVFTCAILIPTFTLMSGIHSPLGPMISWMIIHVRFTAVFRELYHLMVIPALVYACGIACFFRFAERLPYKRFVRALLWASVAVVSLPMLTGDANGWMRAFPLGEAYGDVLHLQDAGITRVLWLPMDQPLSFRGYGAGTDPMAVTARGSLWDYSLNWPLTALDMRLRKGLEVEPELRALSVGNVIVRDDMRSQLASFTVDPQDASRLFSQDIRVAVPFPAANHAVRVFTVRKALPLESAPTMIAFIPQRLDVYASAIGRAYAPVAFSTRIPRGTPYGFFYDPTDVPQEALELDGAAQALPPTALTSVDARHGFAPISAWWWHRPEYADVPNATVAFGKQKVTVSTTLPVRRAVAVLAWISDPVGGHLRVCVGRRSFIVDTRGAAHWASGVFPLGDIPGRTAIEVSSLDKHAEVAVRGFTVLPDAAFTRMRTAWRETKQGAAISAALARAPAPPARPDRPDSQHLLLWNWGYSDGWRVPGATEHLRSAIGTNIFVLRGAERLPSVVFERTTMFHSAYLAGITVCLIGLLGVLPAKCRADPT